MNQANTSSSVPITLLSTQMVMTRGSQTSRPVRMYFFTVGGGERARGRVPGQADWPVLSGQSVSARGYQWQAHDPPQGVPPVSPPDAVLDSGAAAAAAAPVAGALVPPEPPRK